MKRSEIRGCFVAREKPGLRCAPSGLRLLTSCAQQPEGIQETTYRPTVADIAGPQRLDADREVSHGHYPADEIDVPGFDDELARRDIVQGQRNVLFYLVSRPGHHVTKPRILVVNRDDIFELSPTGVEDLILIAHLGVG